MLVLLDCVQRISQNSFSWKCNHLKDQKKSLNHLKSGKCYVWYGIYFFYGSHAWWNSYHFRKRQTSTDVYSLTCIWYLHASHHLHSFESEVRGWLSFLPIIISFYSFMDRLSFSTVLLCWVTLPQKCNTTCFIWFIYHHQNNKLVSKKWNKTNYIIFTVHLEISIWVFPWEPKSMYFKH